MSCRYCKSTINHLRGCPLYTGKKSSYYCSICGEGIYDGEEYIENDDGDFAHLDCLSVREMVEFLGYKTKTMESEDENY